MDIKKGREQMKAVVAVDGSSSAENAINKSLSYGFLDNAEIHLVTVNTTAGEIPASPYMAQKTMEEITVANRQMSADVLEKSKNLFPKTCNVVATVVKEGDPAMELIKYADEIEAEYIIIGSRGLGTFKKTFLGSVSSKVIDNAHCSVIVVRGD